MHCSEHDPQRPPGATHRVIFSLYVDLEPEPGGNSGGKALVVPLDRGGMAAAAGGNGNGRPRPPKQRTIDLRPGDQVLRSSLWATVKRIRVYRGFWMTDVDAASATGEEGYVYRAPR
jgi:hypothetical protein